MTQSKSPHRFPCCISDGGNSSPPYLLLRGDLDLRTLLGLRDRLLGEGLRLRSAFFGAGLALRRFGLELRDLLVLLVAGLGDRRRIGERLRGLGLLERLRGGATTTGEPFRLDAALSLLLLPLLRLLRGTIRFPGDVLTRGARLGDGDRFLGDGDLLLRTGGEVFLSGDPRFGLGGLGERFLTTRLLFFVGA